MCVLTKDVILCSVNMWAELHNSEHFACGTQKYTMYSAGMRALKDKYEESLSMTELAKISFMKHTTCIKK